MRLSPAQRHRMRTVAALSVAAAGAAGGIAAPQLASTDYELQRARLGVDLRRLGEIQSLEAKIALKRDLLPEYAEWVGGVLAAAEQSGKGVQDDVLVHVMIWRIDVGDYEGALPLVAYALRWNLELPQRFSRTLAAMVVEEIADEALKRLGGGHDFDLDILLQVEALTEDEDMHDQIRAKLNKAIGLQLARRAEAIEPGDDGPAGARRAGIEAGVTRLKRALQLDQGSGVKKQIERLEREAAKLIPPPEPHSDANQGGSDA